MYAHISIAAYRNLSNSIVSVAAPALSALIDMVDINQYHIVEASIHNVPIRALLLLFVSIFLFHHFHYPVKVTAYIFISAFAVRNHTVTAILDAALGIFKITAA